MSDARTPRSAATTEEVAADLPGDDLVTGDVVAMDRAVTLPVPPDVLWPWVAQLGKGRAGWYLPRRVEALLPRARRALRHVDPALAAVAVGDEVADWGPGDPVLRAIDVDPPHALVWHSLRDRTNHHRWPADPDDPDALAMSWVLVLDPVPGGTRLHLRLRVRAKHRALVAVGAVFDWLTVVGLFAGLRERLVAS